MNEAKIEVRSRNIENYINQLFEFLPKYQNIKISAREGDYYLKASMNWVKEEYPGIKKFLKDKCDINLKYEAFNY